MPNCCGCFIIYNFGHTRNNGSDANNTYKPSLEEINIFLKKNTIYNKMYVAYINNTQKKIIGKILKANGFRCTGSQYHPNHNSIIYQYTKITMKKHK